MAPFNHCPVLVAWKCWLTTTRSLCHGHHDSWDLRKWTWYFKPRPCLHGFAHYGGPPSVALIFFSGSGEPHVSCVFLSHVKSSKKSRAPWKTRSRLVVSTTTPSCQSLGSQTLSETTHRMDPGLGSDENPTVPWSPAGSWKYGRGDAFNGWPFFMEKMMTNQWIEWRYHILRQTHIYIWCSQMFSSKMCHLCC